VEIVAREDDGDRARRPLPGASDVPISWWFNRAQSGATLSCRAGCGAEGSSSVHRRPLNRSGSLTDGPVVTLIGK
jgi:hypothetical protein